MSLQDSHQISDVKVMLMKGIDGKGIASIEKTSSQGLVDVYTITYTDGTKSTFTVTNGAGGGMSAMFLITSEAGSEISVSSPTGRPLDVTQVSGSSTQWMCETVEYGSHTVVSTLGGSPATTTVNVDVCKIYDVNATHFTANITATFPEGTTCTCAGGGETVFSSSSPHTFAVHSADTYTLTVTYDGTDYTETVTITTDGQTESVTVPSPANAPTDDLNLWLFYGGVTGTYSTLADVLADSTALATLVASSDAMDYLVRCTTWASTITANQSAMSIIGLNNYASNTLSDNDLWKSSIANSSYMTSVWNAKNPNMTSNNAPSGTASANDSASSSALPWRAFDDSQASYWQGGTTSGSWLEYEFASPLKMYLCQMIVENSVQSFDIKAYDENNETWDLLVSGSNVTNRTPPPSNFILNSTKKYKKYRMIFTYNAPGTFAIRDLRYYGREDV